MRKSDFGAFLKIFWPHWVGGVLFIVLFALQLIFILPGRPAEPDSAQGYTIEFDLKPGAVYVSAQDLALLYGTLLLTALIVGSGLLRVRKAQTSAAGQG